MDGLLSLNRRQLFLGGSALGALALLGSGCSGGHAVAPALEFSGPSMGTTYHVRIAGPAAGSAAGQALLERAQGAVQRALAAVVAHMSTYDANSELSLLNRLRSPASTAVSDGLFEVLQTARQVSAASLGAFDITVAPLVGAWGFGAEARALADAASAAPPPQATQQMALGWQHLGLDAHRQRVSKGLGALRLDLSGIAKGYAVDQAALALDALGLKDYMVEAGGEVRTSGRNGHGQPWQIGIERPDAWPQRVHRVLPLSGLAVATSGDYRNFYELEGRRISHTIDPATRAPVAHGLASVSVLHDQCAQADAWATALMVAGPSQGLALAEQQGLAALFIVRKPHGELQDIASSAMHAHLARG